MNDQQNSSDLAGLARIFWMILGPLALILLALRIVNQGESWSTLADALFLVFVLLLPLARCYGFRAGDAQTSTGEPASESDWRRHALVATAIGLGVWITANIVGIYVLDH